MVTYKGESETGKEIANGPWVIWYSGSDQIMEQGFHKNNIRDGLTTYYYENGNKKKEGNLSANINQKLSKPEGVWTYWNKDGQVDFTFDYGKGLDHVKFKDLSKIDESELLYKIDDNTTPFTGVIVDENKEEEYEFLGRLENDLLSSEIETMWSESSHGEGTLSIQLEVDTTQPLASGIVPTANDENERLQIEWTVTWFDVNIEQIGTA